MHLISRFNLILHKCFPYLMQSTHGLLRFEQNALMGATLPNR